jgi:uncharacterized protein YdeI (BOF family)
MSFLTRATSPAGSLLRPLKNTCCLYAVLSSWLLVVLVLFSGCRRQTGTVLGTAPSGEVRHVLAVRAGETPPKVTLKGVIVEKCPLAGCWFYLQDDTGTIKVDTKAAGFVVVNVPLQTRVTVSGTVVTESDDVSVQATGLRY